MSKLIDELRMQNLWKQVAKAKAEVAEKEKAEKKAESEQAAKNIERTLKAWSKLK